MRTAEPDLIEKIRIAAQRTGGPPGVLRGIGDDAALLRPRRGFDTILTCDWFLEGSHFLQDKHPADAVGWKCLARAVSDVAAMGGEPRGFLLSLALPQTHAGRWLDEFLGGLRRAARIFQCPLIGGDTTKRREILINVTVSGDVRTGRAVLRAGARPGDLIFVSGRLGGAELGLRLLRSNKRIDLEDALLKKHLYPEPRLALGRGLANRGIATAMMDLSDGLSVDLPRLCVASRVGARILAAQLPSLRPRSQSRAAKFDPLELAVHGGDDYELLFTVNPSQARKLPSAFQGIPLTNIGEITRQRGVILVQRNTRETPLRQGGWDPFLR